MNALLLTACLAMTSSALPADAPLAPQAPATVTWVAEPALPSASALMAERMEGYLDAERAESRLFVGLGVVSLAGGALALTSDRPALRGASLPVMGVGLIQLLVGGSVWWRTEDQKRALRTQLGSAPAQYATDETRRMKTVNDNFVIYRWAELSLLGAGAALGATGYALDRDFVTGLGLGLAVQSAIMLGLDYFAEQRGHVYAEQVGAFQLHGAGSR